MFWWSYFYFFFLIFIFTYLFIYLFIYLFFGQKILRRVAKNLVKLAVIEVEKTLEMGPNLQKFWTKKI